MDGERDHPNWLRGQLMRRRDFITSAALASLAWPARPRNHRGFPQSLVLRGCGQNMIGTVSQISSSGTWSNVYRSRNYSNVQFRYFKVVLPMFYTSGAPCADALFPNNYQFQVGIEYPFNNSFSGIPARLQVTWSGNSTLSYTANTVGYAVSDLMDIGSFVPAGTFFGIWTTSENSAQTPAMPSQGVNPSDNYQAGWERYTGASYNNTSQISANTAFSASSIAAATSVQSGGGYAYGPAFLLLQHEPNYKSIFMQGDCIAYGIAEGAQGSSTYGDTLGSALGNVGYYPRWAFEKLGYNLVNFGRAQDGFKYFSTTNWKYRLQMLTLANPTHILCQYGTNDMLT